VATGGQVSKCYIPAVAVKSLAHTQISGSPLDQVVLNAMLLGPAVPVCDQAVASKNAIAMRATGGTEGTA
jgi:hypothetical protein